MSHRLRFAIAALGTLAVVALVASPAFAHTEFDPGSAPAGSRTTFELFVENEQSDSGTIQVQLFFPEDQPVTLAASPTAPGWTTTVDGGAVGSAVKSVTWKRATAPPEPVSVPITLGPLPPSAARLQFKVLQTYANGDVDAWSQAWPAGAPEPDMPGPILQVTGSAPTTTTATAAPTTTPTSTTTTTTRTTTTTGTAAPRSDSDDSNIALPIAIAAVVIIAGATGLVLLRRRRARAPHA